MGKKKKREKPVYVDDGRTLADMSAIPGSRLGGGNRLSTPGRARDIWQTYWQAVKMMFLPMLAVIGALVIIYLILYFLFAMA